MTVRAVSTPKRPLDGPNLATLTYGDSAMMRIANVGRRRRKDAADRGFWLDLTEGRWLSEKAATDSPVDTDGMDAAEDVRRKAKVIPYVEDRRNILILRLSHRVDETTATTLRYALERGAEACFQLEDSELSSESLPDLDGRGRMLLTESAEGGAGALRRFVTESDALARIARTALEVAHFDPNTGADLGHAPGARERCERACYECLLAYGNQHAHALIDRHAIRDLLLELSRSTTKAGAGGRSRGEQRDILQSPRRFWARAATSSCGWTSTDCGCRTARRSPSVRPRRGLTSSSTSPTGPVAVFVDGPVHDTDHQAERDAAAEDRLADAGWMVVRVRHDEDWDAVVSRYPSVFGTRRGGTSSA